MERKKLGQGIIFLFMLIFLIGSLSYMGNSLKYAFKANKTVYNCSLGRLISYENYSIIYCKIKCLENFEKIKSDYKRLAYAKPCIIFTINVTEIPKDCVYVKQYTGVIEDYKYQNYILTIFAPENYTNKIYFNCYIYDIGKTSEGLEYYIGIPSDIL